ncbi:GNAT family N-acetyltransferase [Aquimarina atlantica]|uniref:GNAT family N-acetyltransferase n=1 Tax=Aquimarina atlantica TaxID=1317122 RepID=UPI000550C6CD|nr:GNAT family N-acetyltransferase [Aquimarina atlantica]
MITDKSFETERLILKQTSEEDAEFIFQLLNTPKWLKYIGDRNVKTIEYSKEYIRNKITPQFKRLGYGCYTVIRKSDNAKIGTCGLYDRDGLEGIDIGYAFLPDYEGKGYAFESASKLKNVAFKVFGLKTIYAITAQNNNPSQNLLLKLGLEFDKKVILPNGNEELLLYKT